MTIERTTIATADNGYEGFAKQGAELIKATYEDNDSLYFIFFSGFGLDKVFPELGNGKYWKTETGARKAFARVERLLQATHKETLENLNSKK